MYYTIVPSLHRESTDSHNTEVQVQKLYIVYIHLLRHSDPFYA